MVEPGPLLFKRQPKRGHLTRYGASLSASEDEYSSQDDTDLTTSRFSTSKRKKLTSEQQQQLLQSRLEAAKQREEARCAATNKSQRQITSTTRVLSTARQHEDGTFAQTLVAFSDRQAEHAYCSSQHPLQISGHVTSAVDVRRLQHLTAVPASAKRLSTPVLSSVTSLDAKGQLRVIPLPSTLVAGYAIQAPSRSVGATLSSAATLQMMLGLELPLRNLPVPRLVQPALREPSESVVVTSPSQKEAMVKVAAPAEEGPGFSGQGLGSNMDGVTLALVPTTIIGADDEMEQDGMDGEEDPAMDTVPETTAQVTEGEAADGNLPQTTSLLEPVDKVEQPEAL